MGMSINNEIQKIPIGTGIPATGYLNLKLGTVKVKNELNSFATERSQSILTLTESSSLIVIIVPA